MAIIPVWLMVSEKQRPYVSMYPPTPEQIAASTTNDSFWGRVPPSGGIINPAEVRDFEVHIPITDAVKVPASGGTGPAESGNLIILSPTALLEVFP